MSKNIDPYGIMGSMKAYSEDLRRKIVDAVSRGVSKGETAGLFGVSLSSVKRFTRMEREGDSLWPRRSPRAGLLRALMPPGGCFWRTLPSVRRRAPRKGGSTWSA